jgi:flagellar biosynthesis/type III secretory pathway protein FliH
MTELILIGVVGVQTLLLLAVLLSLRRRHRATPKAAAETVQPAPHLTKEELEKLQQSTKVVFEQAVDAASKGFHADLAATSEQLNKLIVRLTTDVVERELEEYRQGLAAARADALKSLQQMQTSVEERQKSLEADVDGELAKRRAFLMEKLDQRLGAAVAAYIVESLGQGADLGAQRSFLLENLERHKDDLKKELAGEK